MLLRRACVMFLLVLAPAGRARTQTAPPTSVVSRPDGSLAQMRPAGAGPVFTLALTPDGKMLASGHGDGKVRLWDPRSGKLLRVLAGGRASVKTAVFTADGNRLVAAGAEEVIRIWEPAAGREVHRLVGPPGGTLALACSADSKMLAAAGKDGAIHLWDLESGAVRGRLAGHSGPVRGLAFSSDGTWLASGGQDRTVRLWDAGSHKERRRLRTPGWVYCVGFSGNSDILAAAGRDQTLHFWKVASGEAFDPLGGYEGPVAGVALDRTGATVFAATEDGKVRRWGVQSGSVLRRLDGHRGAVLALALAPDERMLASGGNDGTIIVWDLDGPEFLWLELGLHDSARAEQIIARLAAVPRAVAFLKERMTPILERAFRVDRLIADLDNRSYAVREHATRELETLGEVAESALRKGLAEKASLERQRRIARILAKMPPADTEEITYSARLRVARALVALERIGTAEARQVLMEVARGPAESYLTHDAQAALDRLAQRPPKR
jgi:hypothetical protein